MEWSMFFVSIGIAVAGYFIGDGLKNFRNPNAKSLFDSLNEDDEHQLIKENDVHYFIGISRVSKTHELGDTISSSYFLCSFLFSYEITGNFQTRMRSFSVLIYLRLPKISIYKHLFFLTQMAFHFSVEELKPH